MPAVEAKVNEAPKLTAEFLLREQWLEAKADNSKLNSTISELRRELKDTQVAVADAQEAVSAKVVQEELESARTAFQVCQAENINLGLRLTRAKRRIAAARKVAEGIAEL
jgi:hypothetical protein